MKTKLFRVTLGLALAAIVFSSNSMAEDKLEIGSTAPELDIEHWVSDGEGSFEHVTKFEKGKVYIVEFWATWCGPCIAAMPHISELQDKYKSKGVQVISVSDEDIETVEKFLERDVRGGEGTYGELTKNYCLTTDPDESVYKGYMRAAGQNGIPTAFVVGKDGKIEWIGHPMSIDKPLEEIVAGTWDREKFAAEYKAQKEMEEQMNGVFRLFQAGKMKEGIKKIDEILETTKDEGVKTQLKMTKFSVMVGEEMDGVAELFDELSSEMKDEPMALNQLAWGIVEMKQAGADVDKKLINSARKAADRAVEGSPKDAAILDTQAHLAYLQGKLEEAIDIQTMAVKNAEPEMKKELAAFLKEMKAELEKDKDSDKKDSDKSDK